MADHGPDVSSYQGLVDWGAEKADGASFAIAKATEGANWDDPTYRRNAGGIRAAGLSFGAYHYAQPAHNAPDVEARHFLSRVAGDLRPGDRVALDLEVGLASRDYAVDWSKAWLAAVAATTTPATGTKPLFYTGRSYLTWMGPRAAELVPLADLWVAAYQANPPSPAPWREWTFWQYTSSATEPGVRGRCDDSISRPSAFGPVVVAGAPYQTITHLIAQEDDGMPLADTIVSIATGPDGKGSMLFDGGATDAATLKASIGRGLPILFADRRDVAVHGASPALVGQNPTRRGCSIDELNGYLAVEVWDLDAHDASVELCIQHVVA